MPFSPQTRAVALGAAVAFLAACSSHPAAAPGSGTSSPDVGADSRRASLDDTLQIQLGRSVSVDGGRLVLTFVARVSDSRCPANVVCVWMGDAVVRIAARAGGTAVEREVHTGIEPRSLSLAGYVVTVVGLLPYPGTEPEGTPAGLPTVVLRIVRA